MRDYNSYRTLAFLFSLCAAMSVWPCLAGDYRIGPSDVLGISVWQHIDLDRRVAVDSDGRISFPPVGEMEVAGMTPHEVANALADKLRIYTRELSQVTVTVVEFNSRKVYVMGEAAKPGIYAFENVPNAWDVIRTAGGPTKDAYLREVRITTGDGIEAKTSVVDLEKAIQEGQVRQLPPLEPGDTIVLSRRPELLGKEQDEQTISVIGAVSEPGIYPILSSLRLTEALMLAGGPREDAYLKKINVIKGNKNGEPYTVLADYRNYLENGDKSGNPIVNAGDAVFVTKRRFSWGITTDQITTIMQITATAANMYLLYRVIEMGRVPIPSLP